MVKSLIVDGFLKKHIRPYLFGLLALIAANVSSVAIPKLLGFVMDAVEYKTMELNEVFLYVGLMLLLGIATFFLTFVYRIVINGRSRDLECYLRSELFKKFQTLPSHYYSEKKTGDLMAHVINDLGAIRMAFAIGIVFMCEVLLINTVSIIVMARTISPILTLISVAPVFCSLFFVIKLRKSIKKRFRKVQDAFADLSGKIQENITGIRVVKAYVQEDKEIEKLRRASRNRLNVQMQYVRLSALLNPVTQIAFAVSFAIELTVGGKFVIDGVISLGDFLAFNTYLAILVRPVALIGRIIEIWQQAFASMNRLDTVFSAGTDITDMDADFNIKEIKGTVQIKDLSFKYPNTNTDALKNISLDLQAGKSLGIIGKTGSGKTTLANLIMRLYQIKNGNIFIDGHDINTVPLAVLRENVSYSPQDNFLFADTIMQNIKFFNEGISDKTVEQSAKIACVYDNIVDFPLKFETIIGERGITLSGGQKQRVSLARAFAKNTNILILDDSFSAVDADTEEKILTNIRTEQEGKTVIMIAHRISTIAACDEIIFMDGGRIIERGTHEQLLEMKGEYYRLNRIQAMEKNMMND